MPWNHDYFSPTNDNTWPAVMKSPEQLDDVTINANDNYVGRMLTFKDVGQ